MKLIISFGVYPAHLYYVCKLKKPPKVGDMFDIVDKSVYGSKPERVRLTDIKTHIGAGDIYFVERM